LNKYGANTGNHIISKKSFWSPIVFQSTAKHPQGKHVEKNMHEATMHEHITHQLVRPEQMGTEIMHPQLFRQINMQGAFKRNTSQEKQSVND
jgi:hypothetical protein